MQSSLRFLHKTLTFFGCCSVYYIVSAQIPLVPALYCVNIQRSPRDLGVSIVLLATSELMARREALRLFPEYKYGLALMRVSLVRYVELDWDSSHFTVAQGERRPELASGFAAPRPQRKRHPHPERREDVE